MWQRLRELTIREIVGCTLSVILWLPLFVLLAIIAVPLYAALKLSGARPKDMM